MIYIYINIYIYIYNMKVFQHFSLMATHQVRIDRVLWFKRAFYAVAARVRYRIAISVVLRAGGFCELLS